MHTSKLMFFFAGIMMFFTLSVSAHALTNVSACGTLSSAGSYVLNQSISSGGNCISITSDNISLDGAGYAISSSAVFGKTIDIETNSPTNITITNSSIIASGSSGVGVFLYSSNSNLFSNNNVFATADGTSSGGVFFSSSNSNTFINNTIFANGSTCYSVGCYGIQIRSSGSNAIIGGSIISTNSFDYYLRDASTTNNFTDTNFTAQRSIYFNDATSWFNYNNQTNGNIWLKTSISVAGKNINRTLINWAQTNMTWNDTASAALTVSYNITGLLPNTYYNVTGSTSQTIATDSVGAFGFQIALASGVVTTLSLSNITDTVAPAITIQSPTNKTYNTNSTWFNATISDVSGISWAGYSLDGVANVTLSNSTGNWNKLNSSMSEGYHTVIFFANDTSGNIGNSSTIGFTINTISPSVVIVFPVNITYNSVNRTLNFSIASNTSNIDTKWYQYNGTNTTITGNTTFTALNNQQSTLSLFVNDTAGNIGSATVTFTVDTIAPQISFVNATFGNNTIILTNATTMNTSSAYVNISLSGSNMEQGLIYFENATSTSCSAYSNCTNLFDGNLSTSSSASIDFTLIAYANYTNIASSFWQVKDFSGSYNLTLPAACQSGNTNQFKIYSQSGLGAKVKWSCYNGTSYQLLKENDGGSAVYEEGLFVNSSIVHLSWNNVNESLPCSGSSPNYVCGVNKTGLLDSVYNYYAWANTTSGNLNQTETRLLTIDAPPTLSVLISPSPAQVSNNLNCTYVFSDLDNDPDTAHWFQWYVNNKQNLTSQTLGPGNFSLNDNLICSVKANDGTENSTWVNSSTLTVGDTVAPSFNSNTISATSGNVNNPFTFTTNFTEANSVAWVYLETTLVGFGAINYTMVQQSHTGSIYIYNYTYTPTPTGTYTFKLYARDGSGNIANLTSNLSYTATTPSTPAPPSGGGSSLSQEIIEQNLTAISLSPEIISHFIFPQSEFNDTLTILNPNEKEVEAWISFSCGAGDFSCSWGTFAYQGQEKSELYIKLPPGTASRPSSTAITIHIKAPMTFDTTKIYAPTPTVKYGSKKQYSRAISYKLAPYSSNIALSVLNTIFNSDVWTFKRAIPIPIFGGAIAGLKTWMVFAGIGTTSIVIFSAVRGRKRK